MQQVHGTRPVQITPYIRQHWVSIRWQDGM